MKSITARRSLAFALALVFLCGTSAPGVFTSLAQSRRQPPSQPTKKNQRPEEGQKTGDQQEQLPSDIVAVDADPVKVSAALVNVETVVYHKKTGQIVTNLKKENFAIFEDGVKQEITNFSTPEAPITVAMILEYSHLTNKLGGDIFEPGRYEVLRPMAMFLQQFIRPPDDFVSVVAYDMRATPLTDFTNDPARISQVISLMLRNRPASSEANLFDALKLVLIGGRGDSVVLEESKSRTTEYEGMVKLNGRRKAVFLVSSGVDTFSKINYGQLRKIVQNAGVPIYIVGTGNLFYKKYSDYLDATDDIMGNPGRLTLLQAQNTLRTIAKESGGEYFPFTFEGELPTILNSINALMRNQYSLGYSPGTKLDGKQHKIVVKVDVDGDGQYDDKDFVVKNRPFYNAPKPEGKS